MVDIFDEVEEDLRAERAQRLFQRYGVFGAVAVVLILIGVGVHELWQARRQRLAEADATRFLAAAHMLTGSQQGSSNAAAQKAFAKLTATAQPGYRTLARLNDAALLGAAGDNAGAIALYDKVAADPSADKLLRGLATLLSVQRQIDTGNPARLQARLAPLTAQGQPWRPLAQEDSALLEIRAGKKDAARNTLRGLSTDPTLPEDMRQRSASLLARISG